MVSDPKSNGNGKPKHYGRDHRGWFVKGQWRGGPGRPPKSTEEKFVEVAQQFALTDTVDAIELARRCSPAVVARLVELATSDKTEPPDAIAAARIVLERAHGLPTVTTMNLNADVTPTPERLAAAGAALSRLRELISRSNGPLEAAPRAVEASPAPDGVSHG